MPKEVDITAEGLRIIEEREKQALAQEKARSKQEQLDGLLEYCNSFQKASEDWRKASFEPKWENYRRMADGIYDPVMASKKEGWQSKAFIPIVPSHRETIQAALFRTLMGPRPPLEVKSRGYIPEEADQGNNIRDLILRETEKSNFEQEFNRVLDDATTYGSGFCRVRWEHTFEMRKIRQFKLERIDPEDMASLGKAFRGERQPIDVEESLEEVETFRGVKFEYLSIWDIYPDPDSFRIQGSRIAYEFKETQGSIKEKVEDGVYLPQAYTSIIGESDDESDEEKDPSREADRDESEETKVHTEHSREVRMFEFFCEIPRKWAFPGEIEDGDPEELICCRVIFHNKAVCAVSVNEAYDGEPQIYKLDYLQVAQRFYGRGIPEMLNHIQEVVNETVNQRIDNTSLVLNKMWVAVSQYLLNPNSDFESRPGGVIRVSKKAIDDGKSVSDIVHPLEVTDVTRSSYADVQEMERYAQERTSANRTTLGTAGQVSDANKTLGGMQLVRQAAGEKFAYIGLLMEFTFLRDIWKAYWRTIYANISPEDVVSALGPQRASMFKLITPEEIDKDYSYEPMGVFTMENKLMRQNRLLSTRAQFIDQPFVDQEKMFDEIMIAGDEDPEQFKLSPDDMKMKMMAQAQLDGSIGPAGGEGIPPGEGAPGTEQQGPSSMVLPPGAPGTI